MVFMLHIGEEQFFCFFQGFSVQNKSKRWQFCILDIARTHGHISNIKKSFRTFVDTILGHPVYRFPPKPEISDFTGSGFGFPYGHRLWKYVSLCLTNSYFMTNALRSWG